MRYTAELWTAVGQFINGQHVTHEHWVVWTERGEVVAAGGEKFCRQYTDSQAVS